MSTNTTSKLLLIFTLFFSLQTNAATNFQSFPDLQVGSVSSYVKQLQKVLNSNGFLISSPGQAGSLNNETTKFGVLTQKALKDFQSKYKISPVTGNFATKTKVKFNELFKGYTALEGKVSSISKGTPVSYGTQTCSSITYYSITWTFASPVVCGSFANGEPWVVGPVVITNINPKTEFVIRNPGTPEQYTDYTVANSGSMILTVPNSLQGYQTKLGYISGWDNSLIYDSSLDLSLHLPYQLNSGDMIMTSRGQAEQGDVRSTTNEIAVLTALSVVPAEGSFRPALWSTGPRVVKYNKSNINYSVLRNFPAVPGTPTQASIEVFMPGLPWFEFDNRWVQSSYGPANNFATDGSGVKYPNASSVYGQGIAEKWSLVSLWLNINNTNEVKEKTMIQTIQSGIDIASYIRNSGVFLSDGGHKVGRKFPTLLAGLALNDTEILSLVASKSPLYFAEDQTTFVVCGVEDSLYCPPGHVNDVGRIVIGGVEAQYTQAEVGLADWGIRHSYSPQNDNKGWGSNYRNVQWPAMSGQILAAEIMGQKSAWNHVETFLYNDSYIERVGGPGDSFFGKIWDAYKPVDGARVQPVTFSPNGGTFGSAKLVTLSSATVGTEIMYTTDGTVPNVGSNLYSTPISVSSTQTIRAIAIKSGMRTSAVATVSFIFRPSANWSLHYVDSVDTLGFNYAANAFDGNPNTFWHTRWRDVYETYPHEFQLNLGERQMLDGFSYLSRQDYETDGVGQYEFYVSIDGINWGSPVATGTFEDSQPVKIVSFPPTNGQYIRLKGLTNSNGYSGYMNIAELGVSIYDPTTTPSTDTDSDGVLDTEDKCPATPSAYRTSVNTYGCPKPLLSTLKLINNIGTTDFTNVEALELEDINSAFGKIRYIQPVNIFGTTDKTSPINFDSYINIQNKKVIVNSNTAPQFNKQATVTLYNINMTRPTVTKDGVVYATSTSPNMSYDPVAKTLTFTADGF